MKQHENDLNMGPLTVSGFEPGSCYQAIFPCNSRTHAEPNARSHKWFRTLSGIDFEGLNHKRQDNHSAVKLKIWPDESEENPGMVNLYPEITLTGFPGGLAANKYRSRTAGVISGPEKVPVNSQLADISGHMPWEGIEVVTNCKIVKPSCRTVDTHSGVTAARHPDFQMSGKSFVLGRNFKWLNQQVELVYGQNYTVETGLPNKQNNLKLILN